MATLKHPNGASVTVPDAKVAGLVARGFTTDEKPKPARKATKRTSKK